MPARSVLFGAVQCCSIFHRSPAYGHTKSRKPEVLLQELQWLCDIDNTIPAISTTKFGRHHDLLNFSKRASRLPCHTTEPQQFSFRKARLAFFCFPECRANHAKGGVIYWHAERHRNIPSSGSIEVFTLHDLRIDVLTWCSSSRAIDS
jgi:hypothetical protein